MAKSNASEMLTSLDSLFTTQEQRDEAKRDSVQDIPISQISDFPEHPFKVKQDEAMLEMVESVRQYGVLVPGLVRQLEDGSYQMVSGHRRKMASELAGRDTIPCIVRDLTDDEAVIIMVDSNLQRERVLPSEKAFAYKMKLDAMRRQQGERTDLFVLYSQRQYGGNAQTPAAYRGGIPNAKHGICRLGFSGRSCRGRQGR